MREDEGGDGEGAVTLVGRLSEIQAAGDDAVVVSGYGNRTALHVPGGRRKNKMTTDVVCRSSFLF